MKRNNIFYIAFLSLSLLGTSCSKEFLEAVPTNQVSSSNVFSSIENVKLAMNGTYRILYLQISNQRQDGHGAMMINMDAAGEDLVWSGNTYTYFKVALRWVEHRNEASEIAKYPFLLYYRVISNCNMIIENVDGVEAAQVEKNALKGEAMALRAWCHYNMVQLYGKRYVGGTNNSQPGIPVMVSNSSPGEPRSSVEAVYEQINADLDEAIIYLAAGPTRNYKTHINVNVARGIKARVALTMQNWEIAVAQARLARDGFALMNHADYLAGFTNSSNVEWMWGITQLADQLATYGNFYAYMSHNFNSSWNRIEPKMINSRLYAEITDTDIRKKIWWDGTAAERSNFTGALNASTGAPANGAQVLKYVHRKFVVPDYTTRAGDIPYMRAAEMYLIEAEAMARSTQYSDAEAAQALYPLAVNRDPSYVLSTNTGSDLIDEIMIQRRVELWGEGFRFYDLKRTDSDLDRTGMDNPMISSTLQYIDIAFTLGKDRASVNSDWEWMIPQDELDVNPSLGPGDQNP